MNRTPMRRCGRQYGSEEEAFRSRAGQRPGAEVTGCRCGKFHVTAPAAAPRRKPRPRTGFSTVVKLRVRARAGNGDPSQALCEACGCWPGLYGGELQHVVARGMGGCTLAVINSAANAALLCRPCHGLAESRDRDMLGMGFWLPRGTDPRAEPMMLHGKGGGGLTVWRDEAGQYLYAPPGELAA